MPEPQKYAHIGQAIRALRQERDWLQADLAAKVGVSQEYISMVETGRQNYTNMKLDGVERFAVVFDLHAADLIAMISRQEMNA